MSTDTDSAAPTTRLNALLRHDLPASVVVFLVALPLSLGVAVASGAPVAAGLIAAAVGGVVAGAVGGSAVQVSGPTASLTVVVAESIHHFGWAVTCFITVGAGVLQILFGLSRIARATLAIAPVVVHGMLAGIGVIIALQQVHVLLGGDSLSSSYESLIRLPHQVMSVHSGDLCVGLVVIAILIGWKFLPRSVRAVPGPLVAVVAATVLSLLLPTHVERLVLDGSLVDAIGLPALPHGDWFAVGVTVVTVALIASVETLLSAVAVDKLRPATPTNFDRELVGQGAANVTSGLLGGLPIAAVIVRSITNANAGARSRAATVTHGVWILLFAIALAGVVQQVPKAALAGLLILIGVQLVKLAHIRLARRTGDLYVYLATVLGVVFWNLLMGMVIGLVLSFAVLLWRVVRVNIAAAPAADGHWVVTIDGTCTFLALPTLTAELAAVPHRVPVTVQMTVDFLDHASWELITEWARRREDDGGTVDFVEMGTARMAAATDGPPERGHARQVLERVIKPRRRSGDPANPIAAGIAEYHRGHRHLMRGHLRGLHDRREADSFFLTCADARIVPNVITDSGPGDLYTVRNVGNLAPVGGGDVSVEAALIYALEQLEVRAVVVCGHSGCGAMDALHREVAAGPGLDDWLAHARPSLDRMRLGHPVAAAAALAGFGVVDQLAMVNVAVQLEALSAHPAVRRGVRERGVEVSGLFFDLATARVIEVTVDGIAEFEDDGERVAVEPV
ncbi:SulP family inorganic anion transporter [Nocardia bovistercoris]|uniref:Bifunctional SulP family inorganic anion transporter/carbonic anhydrase n=1 Tax=Nocardia bovistercoris TaxID=2785916 RepID=A0A931I7V0_9NOCA|nr:bifunctional SulP family inorganic anion transporter/carbonic anhydrase [Nocardia bovistercoris]MBH0775000.1 bifunctional SulP family inorganic anion transporter/carbonic anhydrase [Nocardia bovistercoris]